MYYVYDLIDPNNVTVYVGETINPSRRLSQHLKCNPSKFYKQDLCIVITSEWPTKTEALKAEGARKLELGMEWTEKTRGKHRSPNGGKIAGRIAVESGHLASIRSAGGRVSGRMNVKSGHLERIRSKEASSKGGKAGAKVVAAMRVQCTYCDMISTPGAIGKHKKTCKQKPQC